MELFTLMKWRMKSGYHVYGSGWKANIGDFLLTELEVSNEDDKFAVAVYDELGIDGKKIVGHLPVEFSRIAAYFIENGGEISCKVTELFFDPFLFNLEAVYEL